MRSKNGFSTLFRNITQSASSVGQRNSNVCKQTTSTVWCAISANGITGPLFFENEAENAITVNSQRYFTIIP